MITDSDNTLFYFISDSFPCVTFGGKCLKPYGEFLHKRDLDVATSCIIDPKCAAYEYDNGQKEGRLCLPGGSTGGDGVYSGCGGKSSEMEKEF